MFFVEKSRDRQDDTGNKTQEIHEIEDAQLSLLIAAKGSAVPDIPDISPETENTFYSLIHDQSLGLVLRVASCRVLQ
jgi:hypothetical protein